MLIENPGAFVDRVLYWVEFSIMPNKEKPKKERWILKKKSYWKIKNLPAPPLKYSHLNFISKFIL